MKNYKLPSQNNISGFEIHVLDSTDDEHFLPAGCIQITDEEAAAILEAQKPVVDPITQLNAAKSNGLARISDYAKSKRALIAGTSDDAEIAGWNNKLRIALGYQATTATAAEVLAMQVEIDSRGLNESVDVFVDKVLANAAFYAQAVGLIDGLKRRAQDAVSASDSPEAVEVVLTQMRSQAEAAFVQLMAAAI